MLKKILCKKIFMKKKILSYGHFWDFYQQYCGVRPIRVQPPLRYLDLSGHIGRKQTLHFLDHIPLLRILCTEIPREFRPFSNYNSMFLFWITYAHMTSFFMVSHPRRWVTILPPIVRFFFLFDWDYWLAIRPNPNFISRKEFFKIIFWNKKSFRDVIFTSNR